MRYIAFITLDNWHLANNVHCPSADIYPQLSEETDDEYFARLEHEFDRLGYKTYKRVSIDKEYILSKLDEDGYARIPVIYPREGYIILYAM